MTEVLEQARPGRLVLHTAPALKMDDHRLYELCRQNKELRIERDTAGDLIIMAPTGGGSSRRNARLTRIFDGWAEKDGSGQIFDSSAGFILPNGAMRSPDVSWVRNERLEKLTEEEWEEFLPLCPDFVLELRSKSDSIRTLQEKMEEYLENGAQLGWIIDPMRREVHVYEAGMLGQVLNNPTEINGGNVLPGFVLRMAEIWAV